jgi:hypothetical protein
MKSMKSFSKIIVRRSPIDMKNLLQCFPKNIYSLEDFLYEIKWETVRQVRNQKNEKFF